MIFSIPLTPRTGGNGEIDRDFESFLSHLFSDNRILFEYSYALLVKVRKGNKFYTIGDREVGIIFVDIHFY